MIYNVCISYTVYPSINTLPTFIMHKYKEIYLDVTKL